MKINNIWRVAVLSLAACAVSSAQVAEFGVSGGIQKVQNAELGQDYSLDDGWKLRFHLTLNNGAFFGQEFGYGYNRTKLLQAGEDLGGMAIHQGFWNFLVYATPEGSRFRPFATGGGHFSNFVPPGASATQGQGDTKFGVNYGAGLKVKVTDKYLIRFDLRQYLNGKPFSELREGAGNAVSGTFRQTEASIGFAFTL